MRTSVCAWGRAEFVLGRGPLWEGALGLDPEQFLVCPACLHPLAVPIPVRTDPDAPRGVTLHGQKDEAHRKVVGLASGLAEVERLLGGGVPRGKVRPFPRHKERLVALVLPPVETDVVGRDLGVPALGRVVLPCEDDLLVRAVIEDLKRLEADLLPLLLGEVALAADVVRVSDG